MALNNIYNDKLVSENTYHCIYKNSLYFSRINELLIETFRNNKITNRKIE